MITILAIQPDSIVVDSVNYLIKSDVSSFYMDMMEKQATQFTILISVVSVIFVAVVGATWWWNYKGAKQQIKDEVDSAKQSLYRLYKANQKQIQKDIDNTVKDRFETYVADFQQQVNDIDTKNTKQFEKIQKETTDEITNQKAELCRLFALYSETSGHPINAISWWTSALKNYMLINNEEWGGISCDGLKQVLQRFDLKTINSNYKNHYDFTGDIEDVEKYMPLVRSEDKKYIIQRLKEIQKKIDEA